MRNYLAIFITSIFFIFGISFYLSFSDDKLPYRALLSKNEAEINKDKIDQSINLEPMKNIEIRVNNAVQLNTPPNLNNFKIYCSEMNNASVGELSCSRSVSINLMNSGILFMHTGDFENSEKYFLSSIANDPEFSSAYFNMSMLQAKQNKGSEAVETLSIAISKGYSDIYSIDQNPDFQKLKYDADLKIKIDYIRQKIK